MSITEGANSLFANSSPSTASIPTS